ncbi:uncharacterized protein JCM10292_002655 [Rhodotorula paludigena]|uniref:uncharacterized protein n=1 Tax=Rhodotorula paludigena TaxID=86838 RepID=UPI00317C02C4
MPAKRPKTAVYASPARVQQTRPRKRQKTARSAPLPRRLNSDGSDEDAAYQTDSDYEDEHEPSLPRKGAGEGSSRRLRRTSAPAAAAGGSQRGTSTGRRSSLPGAAGPRRQAADRPRALRGGKEDAPAANVIQHFGRATRTARSQHPLSPLPVNHDVEPQHAPTRKGKERARDDESNRRSREASGPPAPARVTRRTSGGLAVLPEMDVDVRTKRTVLRRSSWATVGSDDEPDLDDDDEDSLQLSGPSRRVGPRHTRSRSRSVLEDISDAGETADGEADGDDGKGGSPEGEIEQDDIDDKLHNWAADDLRNLLVSELTDLWYHAYPSSSSSHAAPRLKADLVSQILAARSAPASADDASDDDHDSPQPRTSHEASPEDDLAIPRRTRRSSGAPVSRGAPVKVVRRRGVRQQEPTPPPSDGEDIADEEDEGEATEVEDSSRQASTEPPIGGSTRMTRRASQVEMPPPPLPPAGGRRHMRTRSSVSNVAFDPAEARGVARATSGPKKDAMSPRARLRAQLDERDEDMMHDGTTPVAHRTRGHQQHAAPHSPSPPPRGMASSTAMQLANSPRPLRAAKRKAVVRLAVTQDSKGKSRAADEDASEDDEEDDEMGEVLVLSDSDDEVDPREFDASIPRAQAEQRKRVNGGVGRRRSARTAKQVETPPSDADEESGDETEHQAEAGEGEGEDETVEASSHFRQHGRHRRKDRVIRLSGERGKERAEEQDEDELMGDARSDSDDERDMSYEQDEDEHDDDEINLSHATSTTLMRCKKDELVRLCEERDLLDHEARTKQQLIDALLQWRDKESEASSPISSPLSSSSTISNLSTETAREETKTQALNALEHASARTNGTGTPLLMRPGHSASPEKPRTPEHSKEHEQQEDVNALDLESLQLRDKEIQPEELTKLERVGSGGFKDVFKGLLDGRTIAICDIRGHLTDMDIKELGLLRDLRHKNIVKFIGVSIPRQPSLVPVMIVTELCANGDLFDYIRKTAPPPFTHMLEIMLGIARGIDYLHKRKPTIIHRDIKSSNVLITGEGVPKIADFGLARIKTSTKSMIRSLVGTVNWQAPELWHPHPRYNEKVDVYSTGLVFWEVLQWHQPVKRYPFEGQNEHAIYHDVGAKQLRPPAGPLRRQWGSEIIDLMTQMWDQDSARRPAMSQVVAELQQLLHAEKAKERAAARRG